MAAKLPFLASIGALCSIRKEEIVLNKVSLLIIDPSQGASLEGRLRKYPGIDVVGTSDSPDVGFTMAERYRPDIVMLNVDFQGDKGVSLAEALAAEFPDAGLVFLTGSETSRVLRLALDTGAKDVVILPVDDDKLERTVERAIQQHMRRAAHLGERKRAPQFKTITVFSTKGGVGKTTVALNLALAIRSITGGTVALVDLDLFSGNLALMAGVPWKHSIKDLVDDINTLDEESLHGYCAEGRSGVRILSAPVHPDFAGFVQPEHVQTLLGIMNRAFNYVIVDAPSYVHDTVIPALEKADEILLITTLDLASVQNLKQCAELLDRLSMRTKARIVVNRAGYSGGLKVKDLEDELGMPVECVIPNNDKAAVDAVNLGEPLFASARNSLVGRRFEELAVKMLTDEDRLQSPAASRAARRK